MLTFRSLFISLETVFLAPSQSECCRKHCFFFLSVEGVACKRFVVLAFKEGIVRAILPFFFQKEGIVRAILPFFSKRRYCSCNLAVFFQKEGIVRAILPFFFKKKELFVQSCRFFSKRRNCSCNLAVFFQKEGVVCAILQTFTIYFLSLSTLYNIT